MQPAAPLSILRDSFPGRPVYDTAVGLTYPDDGVFGTPPEFWFYGVAAVDGAGKLAMPGLVDPKVIDPGLARAASSTSFKVLNGVSGLTVSTLGVSATSVTGWKSLISRPPLIVTVSFSAAW